MAKAPDDMLAGCLRAARTAGQAEVDRAVAARDAEEGEFVSHEMWFHHFGEARH